MKEHIDQMMASDLQAPRKQRHTAHPTRRGSDGAALCAGTEVGAGQEATSWARKRRWTGSRAWPSWAAKCDPASGNEKGGVEGGLGWFQRNWLVPVPEASGLDALNQQILDACLENRSRTIIGRSMTIGQASELERGHLSPRAEEGFPIHDLLYPLVVDSKGRVKVKTNLVLDPALARAARDDERGAVDSRDRARDNKVAAQHTRCYGRGHQILDLEHYRTCWRRSLGPWPVPGPCSSGVRPDAGPPAWTRSGKKLEQCHGKNKGSREMISLAHAGFIDGWDKLIVAVEEALRLGISDATTVLHLLHMPNPEQRRQHAVALVEELLQLERPMPVWNMQAFSSIAKRSDSLRWPPTSCRWLNRR